jgi:hypothetical protein
MSLPAYLRELFARIAPDPLEYDFPEHFERLKREKR